MGVKTVVIVSCHTHTHTHTYIHLKQPFASETGFGWFNGCREKEIT